MLIKQTVQTIGIQAENMKRQRKLPKKDACKPRKIGHSIGLADVIKMRKLVDFPITCKFMTAVGFLSI